MITSKVAINKIIESIQKILKMEIMEYLDDDKNCAINPQKTGRIFSFKN